MERYREQQTTNRLSKKPRHFRPSLVSSMVKGKKKVEKSEKAGMIILIK